MIVKYLCGTVAAGVDVPLCCPEHGAKCVAIAGEGEPEGLPWNKATGTWEITDADREWLAKLKVIL